MSNKSQPEAAISQLKTVHNELLHYARENVEDTRATRIFMVLAALLRADEQGKLGELVDSDVISDLASS